MSIPTDTHEFQFKGRIGDWMFSRDGRSYYARQRRGNIRSLRFEITATSNGTRTSDRFDLASLKGRSTFANALADGDDALAEAVRDDLEELLRQVQNQIGIADAAREVRAQSLGFEVDPCTDVRNASRFADACTGRVRHVRQCKAWYLFDDTRWAEDRAGDVLNLATDVAVEIYAEAADPQLSKDARDVLARFARSSSDQQRLKAMLALGAAKPGIATLPEEFDRDPSLLACPNCVVDLRTGKPRRGSPEDMITKSTGTPYDPSATAPRWEKFLREIMADDEDLVAYQQRAVGYSLTGSTREQVLFVAYGKGANGKGVFAETLREAIGEYASVAEMSVLMGRDRDTGPRDDIAALSGCRFVTASETRKNRRLDEATVKWLTGSDRIRARKLYANAFEFAPTHKLWLSTNHRPRVSGDDHAIWRRLRLIPFTVSFKAEDGRPPDVELPEKLREELPGILAWAVRGAVQWHADGLQDPPAVLPRRRPSIALRATP